MGGGGGKGGKGGATHGGAGGIAGDTSGLDCSGLTDFPNTCDVPSGAGGEGGADSGSDASCGPGLEPGGGGEAGSGGDALILIDDFEDGDQLTYPVFGAVGGWYTVNDSVGRQFPTSQCFQSSSAGQLAPQASAFAAHTYGSGFLFDGYAQLGVGFRTSPPACDEPLDASSASGVRFRIRSAFPQTLRFTVGTVATTPPENGGTCVSDCYNGYISDMQMADGWNEYYVPFASLLQQPWGERHSFDAATILTLIWQAADSRNGQGSCFDFWLDDVAFYKDQ